MIKSKKILSVDDSPSIRKIVKSCLEQKGYEVDESFDGQDALEKTFSNKDYDVLVVDVHMPNMDGISFVKEFRKKNDKTPIIMLTTESAGNKKLEGKKVGANGWVVKPFDPQKFGKVIDRLVSM